MHFSFSTKSSLYTGKKREDAIVDTVDVLELPRLLHREQSWTLKVSRAVSSSYCSFAARCSPLISLISCVGGTSGKEPDCQCRRHKRCGFNPWVGKIPWRRAWQLTPVFLPGKLHGQRTWWAIVHRVTNSLTQPKWFDMHARNKLLISFDRSEKISVIFQKDETLVPSHVNAPKEGLTKVLKSRPTPEIPISPWEKCVHGTLCIQEVKYQTFVSTYIWRKGDHADKLLHPTFWISPRSACCFRSMTWVHCHSPLDALKRLTLS